MERKILRIELTHQRAYKRSDYNLNLTRIELKRIGYNYSKKSNLKAKLKELGLYPPPKKNGPSMLDKFIWQIYIEQEKNRARTIQELRTNGYNISYNRLNEIIAKRIRGNIIQKRKQHKAIIINQTLEERI